MQFYLLIKKKFFFCFQLREIVVAVGGGAIVFAVTTLLCVKFVTIIASSIVGSTMIMSAIDFFMHGSDTIHWVRFPVILIGNFFILHFKYRESITQFTFFQLSIMFILF